MKNKAEETRIIKTPICITPINGIGLLVYEALKSQHMHAECVCDTAFDSLCAGKERVNREYLKYNLMSTEQAYKKYPDGTFIVASWFYRKEITAQLRRLGIQNILYAEQILKNEHKELIKLLPEKGYNQWVEANPSGYARFELPNYLSMANGSILENILILCKEKVAIDLSGGASFSCDIIIENLFDVQLWIDETLKKYKHIVRININIHFRNQFSAEQWVGFVNYINSKRNFISGITITCHYKIHKVIDNVILSLNGINLMDGNYNLVASAAKDDVVIRTVILKPFGRTCCKNRAAFIHVPKAAGTAVASSLGIEGKHFTALEYLNADKEKFSQYFKFAIVRNPWDRLVSSYYYAIRTGEYEILSAPEQINKSFHDNSFSDFVLCLKDELLREWLINDDALKRGIIMPQYKWFCDENDNIIVDYVGRFEKLQESYEYIGKRLGLDVSRPLPKVNASKHKPYQEYYDDETREIVREVYKKDIEMFGYEFEYLEK